jgi:hypothetical protein
LDFGPSLELGAWKFGLLLLAVPHGFQTISKQFKVIQTKVKNFSTSSLPSFASVNASQDFVTFRNISQEVAAFRNISTGVPPTRPIVAIPFQRI